MTALYPLMFPKQYYSDIHSVYEFTSNNTAIQLPSSSQYQEMAKIANTFPCFQNIIQYIKDMHKVLTFNIGVGLGQLVLCLWCNISRAHYQCPIQHDNMTYGWTPGLWFKCSGESANDCLNHWSMPNVILEYKHTLCSHGDDVCSQYGSNQFHSLRQHMAL